MLPKPKMPRMKTYRAFFLIRTINHFTLLTKSTLQIKEISSYLTSARSDGL